MDRVLRNLVHLKEIDYHAEEILYLLAEKDPERVLYFLCQRLAVHSQGEEGADHLFDAIPFELHKLNGPLSKIPREAVNAVKGAASNVVGFEFREALFKDVMANQPEE
jgi:hypothetical protein